MAAVAPDAEAPQAPAAFAERSVDQPLIERRILFHPARKSGAAISEALLPKGVVILNRVDNGEKATGKRSWLAMSSGSEVQKVENSTEEINLEGDGPLKIGAGLSNLGNTCFLNSVLQCLTYTAPLTTFLESGQHKSSCRNTGFCALCAVEVHVKNAVRSWGKVVAPNNLVKNLRCISKSFQPWRQEDAHEYLRCLLEAMHKACLSNKASNSPSDQERSLMYKIFGGRLRSQVKCTVCQECSETVDPFLDLSLEINQANSIGKALARFTAVEVLDGDNKYHCSKCKKKVRALKRFTIDAAPNVLTVQFKRFSSYGQYGRKIDKQVQFGTGLNLKPFMTNGRNGALYELYGVLVHSGGSTHSGHYYCFVRTKAGIWHVLDDTKVKQCSEQGVLEQKAYILFYKRKQQPRPEVSLKDVGSLPGSSISSVATSEIPSDGVQGKHSVTTKQQGANMTGSKLGPQEEQPPFGRKESALFATDTGSQEEALVSSDKESVVTVEEAATIRNEMEAVRINGKPADDRATDEKMQDTPLEDQQTAFQHEQNQRCTMITDASVLRAPLEVAMQDQERPMEVSGTSAEKEADMSKFAESKQASTSQLELEIQDSPTKSKVQESPRKLYDSPRRRLRASPWKNLSSESPTKRKLYDSPRRRLHASPKKNLSESPTKSQDSLKRKLQDSPKKSYLRLLRSMPKSRRFLLARAIDPSQGENCKRRKLEVEQQKEHAGVATSTAKNSPGAPSANAADFLASSTATSAPSASRELFGVGVPRWEGVQAKGIDEFLKTEHKECRASRDEWDEEYDRGKVKKVRRGAGGGRLTPSNNIINNNNNNNVFQALANNKL